jgi:hypothetical protein
MGGGGRRAHPEISEGELPMERRTGLVWEARWGQPAGIL